MSESVVVWESRKMFSDHELLQEMVLIRCGLVASLCGELWGL